MMKRISALLDTQDRKATLEKTVPGRFWPGATVSVAIVVCLSLSVCLTFRTSEAADSKETKTEARTTAVEHHSARDRTFTDDEIASRKERYQLVSAQYKVGHPNGTVRNLAEATIDYYDAKLSRVPQNKRPDPNDVKHLLEQAEILRASAKAMFDAGLVPMSEREKMEERSLELESTYAPILKALLSESSPAKQTGITCRKIDLPLYVFPETENFSTPENAYVSYERLVSCQRDSQTACDSFRRVSIPAFREMNVNSFQYDAERANLFKKTEIIEVYQYGELCSCVVARIHEEGRERPIDVRYFDHIDGKWFNAGNDRFDTKEEALASFGRLLSEKGR